MRHLSETLKTFLDEKIKPEITEAKAVFLLASQACVGVMEEGGDNKGKMVEAFQVTIGGACGESWCLSFQQALIAYVEDRCNVFCDLFETEHCLTLWDKSPPDRRVKQGEDPKPGDLVIWRYGTTDKGHIGVVIKNAFRAIETIEGNTSAGNGIDREGNGVYQRIRPKMGTTTMHLVGYLRPEFKPRN